MLNIKVVSWSLGLFTTISFVLCVIYGLLVPPSLHMAPFLEMVLPAFERSVLMAARLVVRGTAL